MQILRQGEDWFRMKCDCGYCFAANALGNTYQVSNEHVDVLLPTCPQCGLVHIPEFIETYAPEVRQHKFVCGHADKLREQMGSVPYILWKADPNEIDECWRGACPKFHVETDPRGRYASAEVTAHILSQEVRKKLGGK